MPTDLASADVAAIAVPLCNLIDANGARRSSPLDGSPFVEALDIREESAVRLTTAAVEVTLRA
jgi:hypothetical protein